MKEWSGTNLFLPEFTSSLSLRTSTIPSSENCHLLLESCEPAGWTIFCDLGLPQGPSE